MNSSSLYTDMADSGSTLNELTVFEKHRGLFYNAVRSITDPLMKCFMEKKLFINKMQLSDNAEAPEKSDFLLLNVSNCLEAGDTTSFYMMLKIMREHGNGTATLANIMMDKLNISADELSDICSANTHVHIDELKGLFALI